MKKVPTITEKLILANEIPMVVSDLICEVRCNYRTFTGVFADGQCHIKHDIKVGVCFAQVTV